MNLPEYIQHTIPIDWSAKIKVPDEEKTHNPTVLSDWLQAMLAHWGWETIETPILEQRESVTAVTVIEQPFYVMVWNSGPEAVNAVFGKEGADYTLLSRVYQRDGQWKIDNTQPCDVHARLEEWKWYS